MSRVSREDSFWVETEAGERILIDEWQHWISTASHSDPHAEVEGLKEYRTRDGRAVNLKPDGSFEVLDAFGLLKATRVE